MLALIAALTMTAGDTLDRVRRIAENLPPNKVIWSCEVTQTASYCCEEAFRVVPLKPPNKGFICERKAPFGFKELHPPYIVEHPEARTR